MYDLVVLATSPFFLFIGLVISSAISVATNMSSDNYSAGSIADKTASGMGIFLILILAATFYDIQITCRLLLDSNLLQAELAVIFFISLAHMIHRYVRDFDVD